jgi:hypothetical protein
MGAPGTLAGDDSTAPTARRTRTNSAVCRGGPAHPRMPPITRSMPAVRGSNLEPGRPPRRPLPAPSADDHPRRTLVAARPARRPDHDRGSDQPTGRFGYGLSAAKCGEQLRRRAVRCVGHWSRSATAAAGGRWRSCGSRARPAWPSGEQVDGLGGPLGTAAGGMPGQDLGLPGLDRSGRARQLGHANAVDPMIKALPGDQSGRHAGRSVDSSEQLLALPGRGDLTLDPQSTSRPGATLVPVR